MPGSDGGGDFVRVGGPLLKGLGRPAPEAARIYAVLSELGHRLDESIKNMQKDPRQTAFKILCEDAETSRTKMIVGVEAPNGCCI